MQKIIVPETLRNELQKREMEYNARREIIIYILQNNLQIPQERFEAYEKEYDQKFQAFEQLKDQITKEYVQPIVQNPDFWNLNYETCELTIQEKKEI